MKNIFYKPLFLRRSLNRLVNKTSLPPYSFIFGNKGIRENMTVVASTIKGAALGIRGRAAQSRRDDTRLTVGFNLRKTNDISGQGSPAGTTLCEYFKCRPCGTLSPFVAFPVRRLKPTVNQVSSLRDFAPTLHSTLYTLHSTLYTLIN